ncbi:MAG TPA: hypothetical protein VE131_15965 [Terriglobales bacterium]|nr:hypothetical protein [Terriglobales bacterium]
MKSHKDESLKGFSKYVRNPDLGIMAYLYEEIVVRVEAGLCPQPEAVRALFGFGRVGPPSSEASNREGQWDLSLIDEIQKSGFVENSYKQ